MGRPRKEKATISRFSERLQRFVDAQCKGDGASVQKDLAKKLGLSPSQLSKLLTASGPVSVKSVGRVCGNVTTQTAVQLLREYLNDHAERVMDLSGSRAGLGLRPNPKFRVVLKIDPRIVPVSAS
jgi:transcriptional regulator with XRE-family HTH domain